MERKEYYERNERHTRKNIGYIQEKELKIGSELLV